MLKKSFYFCISSFFWIILVMPFYSKIFAATDNILWSADFEDGTIRQWEPSGGWISQDGGKKNSTFLNIVKNPAIGKFSAALSIDLNARGKSGGVGAYLFRWEPLPQKDYYYSAYYYIPSNIKPGEWLNIFQWKSNGGKRLYYLVNVRYQKGKLIPELHYHFGTPGGKQPKIFKQYGTPINLPTDKWFLLQGYFKQDKKNGEVAIYINNTQLVWNVNGKPQKIIKNYPTQIDNTETINWSVNHYTDSSTNFLPKKSTIYIDNVAITKQPVKYSLVDSSNNLSFDLNGDSAVNILDLINLIQNLNSSKSKYDLNNDGLVNIQDVIKLLQYVFK